MTNIYYDTEFIDDGYTIEPISIGMITDDGSSLYRICASQETLQRASSIPWLYENVVTNLPVVLRRKGDTVVPVIDPEHPDFANLASLGDTATDVAEFILSQPKPRLWADYGAYDHVLLAQLFGPMIEMPKGIPWFTHDLRTLMEFAGVTHKELPKLEIPATGGRPHNALFDAMELQLRYRWIYNHCAEGHALEYIAEKM